MPLFQGVRPSRVRYLFVICVLALTTGQSCFNTTSTRPQHLGVLTQDTSVSSVGGVLITEIDRGGAAEISHLQANDILARLDGKVITSVSDLRQRIAAKTFGDPISVDFFRSTSPGVLAGLSIPTATDKLPTVLGFELRQGTSSVDVNTVDANSVADQAGVKPDDRILFVNSVQTTELKDAWRIFAPFTSSNIATLKYTRLGLPTTQPGVDPTAEISLTTPADAANRLAVPGVSVQDLTPTLAAFFNYIPRSGAKITNLYRDTPAFVAGLLVGDIIIGLTPPGTTAEQSVTKATTLNSLVETYAGQTVTLRYLRGQLPPVPIEVPLAAALENTAQVPEIGMLLEATSAAGLRIEQVTSGGPAGSAGLTREDVIQQVAGQNVTTIADFWTRLLAQFDADNLDVVLQVKAPQGSRRFVVLTLTAVAQ